MMLESGASPASFELNVSQAADPGASTGQRAAAGDPGPWRPHSDGWLAMQRVWVGLGGLAGFGAVAMAAIGAHGLDAAVRPILQEGVQMQGWHALALLAVALWRRRGGRLADAAGVAFTAGMLLFCGAVYSLALRGVSLGFLAPVGGTLLMLGWALLAVSALRRRRRPVL